MQAPANFAPLWRMLQVACGSGHESAGRMGNACGRCAVPWAHPDRADRHETSLDAVLNAGPDDRPFSPWIILEDGRMLTPKQIMELRKIISSGSIAAVPSF